MFKQAITISLLTSVMSLHAASLEYATSRGRIDVFASRPGGVGNIAERSDDQFLAQAGIPDAYGYVDINRGRIGGVVYTGTHPSNWSFASLTANFDVFFQNTGSDIIIFSAGSLHASVGANLSIAGGQPIGSGNTLITSSLSLSTTSIPWSRFDDRSTASAQAFYSRSATEPIQLVSYDNYLWTTVLNQDRFEAELYTSKALFLGPTEYLHVSYSLDVRNSSIAAAGWTTIFDSLNTSQLTLQLPANVSAAPNLSWVSVVPEASSSLMLVIGLSLLWSQWKPRSVK